MITVRLSGLLRLDTGVKELELEAGSLRELYRLLPQALERMGHGAKLSARELAGCVVLVNGAPAGKNRKLCDGDEVLLLSPVCGG